MCVCVFVFRIFFFFFFFRSACRFVLRFFVSVFCWACFTFFSATHAKHAQARFWALHAWRSLRQETTTFLKNVDIQKSFSRTCEVFCKKSVQPMLFRKPLSFSRRLRSTRGAKTITCPGVCVCVWTTCLQRLHVQGSVALASYHTQRSCGCKWEARPDQSCVPAKNIWSAWAL